MIQIHILMFQSALTDLEVNKASQKLLALVKHSFIISSSECWNTNHWIMDIT